MNRYLLMDHITLEVARLYSNELGEAMFVAVGDHPAWDIRCACGRHMLEVKLETTPLRTGNVALEFWNTDFDTASGIIGTRASLWLHLLPGQDAFEAIEYEVPRLLKVALEHGVVKSNGRNSVCMIVPLDVFRRYARRIFTISSRFYDAITLEGVR